MSLERAVIDVSELVLLKSERKMLRKMRGRDYKRSEIQHFRSLQDAGMIAPRMSDTPDELGVTHPTDFYYLTDAYWRYVEEHRWFTVEYILQSLVVPIIVGVAAVVITRFLIGP